MAGQLKYFRRRLAATLLAFAAAPALAENLGASFDDPNPASHQRACSVKGAPVEDCDPRSTVLFAFQPPEAKKGFRRLLDIDEVKLLRHVTKELRARGVDLYEDEEVLRDGGLGVTASFRVQPDLPNVAFRIGDRDALGPFYPRDGFRISLRYPLADRLDFSLEGGDKNEIGSVATAGLRWKHADHPLAIGLGMPLGSKVAGGLVVQMRLLLP